MITTVSDKELAQAATIETLRQEVTAWSITAENLEAELEQKQRAANFWKLTAEVMESVRDAIQAAKTDLLELNWKQGDKLIQMTAERDALAADASRYRWLTADLDAVHERVRRNQILARIDSMSYSAACMTIDAVMKEANHD